MGKVCLMVLKSAFFRAYSGGGITKAVLSVAASGRGYWIICWLGMGKQSGGLL